MSLRIMMELNQNSTIRAQTLCLKNTFFNCDKEKLTSFPECRRKGWPSFTSDLLQGADQ